MSVERCVETIVKRRTEQRSHSVAELAPVSRHFVVIKCLAILPGRKHGGVTLRWLDGPDDIVTQIGFDLPGSLGHLSQRRQCRLDAGRENIEMQLHVNGIASRPGARWRHRYDLIIAPIVWGDGNRLELVAQLGRMDGLLIGVIERLVSPGFKNQEPIGPVRLLEKVNAKTSSLLECRIA